MKYSQISELSKESVKEFGALLLLDHLMQYELLQIEKIELENIIDQLENGVTELKKGFFRSDEQEQKLTFEKEELRGSIIISIEGINGTISFKATKYKKVKNKILNLLNIRKFDNENISYYKYQAFNKGKSAFAKSPKPIKPNFLFLSKKFSLLFSSPYFSIELMKL